MARTLAAAAAEGKTWPVASERGGLIDTEPSPVHHGRGQVVVRPVDHGDGDGGVVYYGVGEAGSVEAVDGRRRSEDRGQ